jgi:hypothetical protein
LHPYVKNWQDFLDSLATSGGNIVTLTCCSILSGLMWQWVYSHDPRGTVMTAAFGVFTGFTGALLQAQKGNSSRQQMADRVETTVMPVRTGGQRSTDIPPGALPTTSVTSTTTTTKTEPAPELEAPAVAVPAPNKAATYFEARRPKA